MLGDQMSEQERDALISNLFDEKIDTQSWLHAYHKRPKRPGFIQNFVKDQEPQRTPLKEHSPETIPEKSTRDKGVDEVFQELNFMRDLGPLSRKFAHSRTNMAVTDDDLETKAI